MDSELLQIIRRSRRRVLVGRLAGWLADAVVLSLLTTMAFGTWAAAVGLGGGAWIGYWIGLGSVLGGLLFAQLLRGTSLEAIAVRLDRELGFRDRVSSALAFSRHPEPSGFMRAHAAETARFLQANARRVVAVPWPGRGRAFALFVLVALASLLPHADRSRIERRDRQVRVEQRRHAGQALIREMGELRREAEMAGLTRLSDVIADAERAVAADVELLTPEDLEPPPQPERKSGSDKPVGKTGAADDAEARRRDPAAVTGGAAGEGPRLSNVASYQPVGKFDSYPAQAYTEVFAELDEAIIGDQTLTATELQQLADHVDDTSGHISNFGYFLDGDATGMPDSGHGPQQGSLPPEEQLDNPFESQLAPLQYKAFSEFLKRYAAHLGEKAMGQAHFERSQLEGPSSGEVVDVSAPPPEDAEFAVHGVDDAPSGAPLTGTPEQMAQVAAQAQAQGEVSGQDPSASSVKVRGGGTQPGGQGAGVGGAGSGRQAAPKVLPRAAGGEYLPLEGKLSDGESVIRLIEAKGGRRGTARAVAGGEALSYRDLFIEYARGAEAEINGEQIPLHIRDYIREYLRSIRPGAD